jgi:hypothetical protein
LHVGDGKGLDISHIGHTTLHSPKRIFTLSNVLHVLYITKPLLFVQNSVVIIMFILNVTLLCFISRISSPRKFSFLVRVMMVFMSSLSLLPYQFLKLFGLLASL